MKTESRKLAKKLLVGALGCSAPAAADLMSSFPLIPRVQPTVVAVSVLACLLLACALQSYDRQLGTKNSKFEAFFLSGWWKLSVFSVLAFSSVCFTWIHHNYVSVIHVHDSDKVVGVADPEYVTLPFLCLSPELERSYELTLEFKSENLAVFRNRYGLKVGEVLAVEDAPTYELAQYIKEAGPENYYALVPRGIAYDTTLVLSFLYLLSSLSYTYLLSIASESTLKKDRDADNEEEEDKGP